MNTYQEIDESYEDLREVLGALLSRQQPTITCLAQGDYPLLILETSTDSVGFAVLNGSPREAYDIAYEGFKKLYRARHSEWQDRNLSFVVCRVDAREQDDGFFSSIESDVYFCRKYVIRMGSGRKALEAELARLPFLPLPAGTSGGLIRPPSAQTLLQSINVSAVLARQIVVPREYSARRIIQDVESQEMALPKLAPEGLSHEPVVSAPTERTRVSSISIEAFRAYKKRQEFDLSADVVVLFGRNGLGKTSFFDAIDYLCTGRIGRLCRGQMKQERFKSLARHLDTSPPAGEVRLEITRGSDVHRVTRKVDDWRYAWIGEEKYDRGDLLQFVTSAPWGPRKARIENLERLFRATHLFSQADPELFQDFLGNSILPADLVSRMLALEDYASGIAKVEEVEKLAKREIAEREAERDALSDEIKAAKQEIRNHLESSGEKFDGVQIKKMATTLLSELRSLVGITMDETEANADSVREWRALAEAAVKEQRERLALLRALKAQSAENEENQRALSEGTANLGELSKTLGEANSRLKELEQKKKVVSKQLEESNAKLSDAKEKRQRLVQMDVVRNRAERLGASLQGWRDKLKKLDMESEAASAELQRLVEVGRALDKGMEAKQEELASQARRSEGLEELRKGFSNWEQDRKSAEQLKVAINEAETLLQKLIRSSGKAKKELSQAKDALEKEQREYQRLTEEQTALTSLLDQMERYVRDGVCPTCGIDHGEKEALLKRLRSRKEERPPHVEEVATRCNELKAILADTKASFESQSRQGELAEEHLRELREQLSRTEQRLAAYKQKIEKWGLDREDRELASALKHLHSEAAMLLKGTGDSVDRLKEEKDQNTRKLQRSEKQYAELKDSRKRAFSQCEELERKLKGLKSEAEELGWQLDTAEDGLILVRQKCEADLAEARKRIEEFSLAAEVVSKHLAETQKKIQELDAATEALNEENAGHQAKISQFREGLAVVTGETDYDVSKLDPMVAQTQKAVWEVEELVRKALMLEHAFDAAARTALVAELEKQIERKTAQQQKVSVRIDQLNSVRKWFSEVGAVLNRQRAFAVENHVRVLGPLSATIQKRLHPVYGFGDISLASQDKVIRVSTRWADNEVRPTDYFSESQKQILMLSLFLAGRLAQTWSGFAPILLDDPVTHFDDLNAFGLVELIRGLVSTAPRTRQFLISTCEDRLFELMKAKFRNIEGGAIFYQFDGINADGPIVTKLEG